MLSKCLAFREFAIGAENCRARAIFTLTRLPANCQNPRMAQLGPRLHAWLNAKATSFAPQHSGWSYAECHVTGCKLMLSSQNTTNTGHGPERAVELIGEALADCAVPATSEFSRGR